MPDAPVVDNEALLEVPAAASPVSSVSLQPLRTSSSLKPEPPTDAEEVKVKVKPRLPGSLTPVVSTRGKSSLAFWGLITGIALITHLVPSSWMNVTTPTQAMRKVTSKSGKHHAPATEAGGMVQPAIPTASDLTEVYDAVHSESKGGGCMRAPPEWGPPARVAVSETVLTDPPLIVYSDVLVAKDPSCARITRAKHDAPGVGEEGGGASTVPTAEEVASDSARVVWTTHLNRARMGRLELLDARWGGCISLSLWLCNADDWTYVSNLHKTTEEKGLGAHTTIHVVIGYGGYPYNLQRNVALAPFAPWASGGIHAEPWVLVADADGVPSVGEATMSKLLEEAAAGKLTAPETLWGPVPDSLKWTHSSNDLGLSAITPPESAPETPTRDAAICDAWNGAPQPMQCKPNGHPSGLGWGRRGEVADWAKTRSRCGKAPDIHSTFFVIPSFDTRRDNSAAIAHLEAIDPTLPPSHSYAYLRALWNAGIVELQAEEAYAPSYVNMVPWNAWRHGDPPAGLMAVHYGFIYEPYIVAKAPFPSTSTDKWEPFDEFFREPGYDKCIFFVETAGKPRGSPGAFSLEILPQVFLLNAVSPSGGGPKNGGRHINWERFMNARAEHGNHCQDMCPCVPIANATIEPPQGFHGGRRRRLQAGGVGGVLVGEGEPEEAAEAGILWHGGTGDGDDSHRPMPPAYTAWRLGRR